MRRIAASSWAPSRTTRRSASRAAEPWAARTLTLDLSHLALTPASPKVVALTTGHTLDALLDHVIAHVDADAPLLSQATPGGRLQIRRGEVRFGTRVVTLDGTVKALPYAISANGMTIAALGLVQGEGALMLFACEDAFVEKGAVTGNLTPDAYLPLATWELLRSVVASR